MYYCGKCGAPLNEEELVCPKCENILRHANKLEALMSKRGKLLNLYDETWRFEESDIEENRVLAAVTYVPLGALIGWLLGKKSPYVRFHAAQGSRLLLTELLLLAGGLIITGVLGFFSETLEKTARGILFVPGLALLALIIAGFIFARRGKAQELPLIRKKSE